MRRVRPTPTDTTNCSSLRPNYQTMERFLQYKESSPLNTTDLEFYVGGLLEMDLQNQGTPQEQAAAQARLNDNLGKLRLAEQTVLNMTKCVQQDILSKQNYSGQIYSLQQEIEQKQEEVDSLEQTAKEAKERAQLLENPYTKTTVWESWFPLGRPLEKTSLPVLLSVALLLLVLSLGMFLRLANIELKLHLFEGSSSGYLSGYGIGR
jgi:hypothetical protein